MPLNSIIKSKILVEKHRATLMNIFRIPVNVYVILTLLALKYIDAFTVFIFNIDLFNCHSYDAYGFFNWNFSLSFSSTEERLF
jgi:hypothetical protein